jgi:lysophospholipase L1-like esterase
MLARRLVGLLLPAVLALAVGGCSDSPTAPSSITVIAFGDSITFGVGTTGSNNYVSRLSARTGVPIEKAGRPGDTTADALGRLDGSVLSRDPDIVIAFLGGNDILQGVPVSERIGRQSVSTTTIVERIGWPRRRRWRVQMVLSVGSLPCARSRWRTARPREFFDAVRGGHGRRI